MMTSHADKRSLYRVPHTLDAPARLLGLPLDEGLPAALLGGLWVLSGQLLWAMGIATLVILLIKTLKRGQGRTWCVSVAYWYIPAVVMRVLLAHTPPSYHRDYIA